MERGGARGLPNWKQVSRSVLIYPAGSRARLRKCMMGYDIDHEEWKEKEHEQRVGEEREGLEDEHSLRGYMTQTKIIFGRLLVVLIGLRL